MYIKIWKSHVDKTKLFKASYLYRRSNFYMLIIGKNNVWPEFITEKETWLKGNRIIKITEEELALLFLRYSN